MLRDAGAGALQHSELFGGTRGEIQGVLALTRAQSNQIEPDLKGGRSSVWCMIVFLLACSSRTSEQGGEHERLDLKVQSGEIRTTCGRSRWVTTKITKPVCVVWAIQQHFLLLFIHLLYLFRHTFMNA